MKEIISMGVDQGIANCGYGVIKIRFKEDKISFKVLDYGIIRTESDKSMANRSLEIVKLLDEKIKNNDISIIGCEKLFFSQRRVGGRNKSASMLYTNMATGLLHYLSGVNAIPLVDFVPGTVKKLITGNGRATKEEMISAIEGYIEDDDIDIKNNEHIADAISIALTAGLNYNEKEDYYIDLTNCIKNNLTIPEKRKIRKLKKSEKTKLDKMERIVALKTDDIAVIHKQTKIPRNTVKKYLKEIKEGVLDELRDIEKNS